MKNLPMDFSLFSKYRRKVRRHFATGIKHVKNFNKVDNLIVFKNLDIAKIKILESKASDLKNRQDFYEMYTDSQSVVISIINSQ